MVEKSIKEKIADKLKDKKDVEVEEESEVGADNSKKEADDPIPKPDGAKPDELTPEEKDKAEADYVKTVNEEIGALNNPGYFRLKLLNALEKISEGLAKRK